MKPYVDSNFIVRLYLELPESKEADERITEAGAAGSALLPVTWLHRVEVANAFQAHVFVARLQGQTRVSPETAAAAHVNFREDLAMAQLFESAALPWDELAAQAEELTLRHTARHGFRTYDLLHASSALLLGCDIFWSFDAKASKLAALEGLKIRTSGSAEPKRH